MHVDLPNPTTNIASFLEQAYEVEQLVSEFCRLLQDSKVMSSQASVLIQAPVARVRLGPDQG